MATAMCTTCPHTDPATALAHEATTGHTVSVWDSPTSQLPRALWPAQVPPRPEEILPGSIVRFNGLTPDEEGNHIPDPEMPTIWDGMTGEEYVYLGPSKEFPDLGFGVIWMPGLEFGPLDKRYGGAAMEVNVENITIVARPTDLPDS
jgi:hypothetical protein